MRSKLPCIYIRASLILYSSMIGTSLQCHNLLAVISKVMQLCLVYVVHLLFYSPIRPHVC